jgi:hypothetical protein
VVLLGSKAIPQGGPLQRGRISFAHRIEHNSEEDETGPHDADDEVFKHLPLAQEPCIVGHEDLQCYDQHDSAGAYRDDQADALRTDNQHTAGGDR